VSNTAVRRAHSRLTKVVLIGTAGALALSACSSGKKTPTASSSSPTAATSAPAPATAAASASTSAAASTPADSGEKITLKITDWGDFGLKGLIPQYEALHPNITIVETSGDYNTTHQNLQKFLVAGSGAPDISAIDEGFMVSFRSQADKFVDLNAAAGDLKGNYIPWKWAESMSADGKQIGLGTDVGGLAMCYRTDLFAAAGLPTDRDAVSKLWPTWADFIATGKKYVAATKGKKFLDDAVTIMNPVLGQQPVGYFDSSEKLQMDGGPKAAWDIATQTIAAGLSANLPQSDATAWAAGFKNSAFATVSCPAWMLGQIKTNSTGTNAKWDVADIPGGGGNWGGSWWTVPAQGKHTAEATALIKWLVQPAQQIAVFKDAGNLPSQPALWNDPAIGGYTNPDFGNAPTGKIFTAAAAKLPDPPQYLGKKNGAVRSAVESDLTAVEQGKFNATSGWKQAASDAQKAAEG
jgi:cellobiose transport system substrate-binding protein